MKRLLLGLMVLGVLAGCHTEQVSAPTLITPEDGAVIVCPDLEEDWYTWKDTIIFQWETDLEVITCILQIATDESFYPQYCTEKSFCLESVRDRDSTFSGFTYKNGIWTFRITSQVYITNPIRLEEGIAYWRVFAYSEEDEIWSDPSKVWSFELVKE